MSDANMSTTKEFAFDETQQDPCVRIAGLLEATNFISFINKKMRKIGQHKVGRGEALACFLLLCYADEFKSLNTLRDSFEESEVFSLLGFENDAETRAYFHRGLFTDAFETLVRYGSAKLFKEFVEHVAALPVIAPSEKAQVKAFSDGLPLYLTLFKLHPDHTEYPSLFQKFFDALEKVTSELTFIVGGSDICTAEAFAAARAMNLPLLLRVPLSCMGENSVLASITTDELQDLCARVKWLKQFPHEKTMTKVKVVEGLELYGQKVTACLLYNKKESQAQAERVDAEAKKERAYFDRHLTVQKYKTFEEAQRGYAAFVKKTKYCRLTEFAVEPVYVNARRGRTRPGVEPEKKLSYYVLNVSCFMNDAKVHEDETMKHCLVTTDTERAWTALDMRLEYRNNNGIDKVYEELKAQKSFFSGLSLQKQERFEGLLWLMTVAVFLQRSLLKKEPTPSMS